MKNIILAGAILLFVAPVTWSADSAITSTTLLTTTTSWDNTLLPAYPAGQPQITIARVQIAPGASIPPHLHHHTIAAGVLTQGQLMVVTDTGKTIDLVAGDAVIETIDTWHSGQNTGTVPTELLVFYAGVEGQPVSESKP